MSLAPIFSSEPWALALIDVISDHNTTSISGEGSPRAFSPSGGTLNWSGSSGLSPRAGPSFIWKGQLYSSWHVPAGHMSTNRRADLELSWRSVKGDMSGSLVQKSLLQRPEGSDTDSDSAKQGKFIDWLVHSFQELGQDELQDTDAAAGGLVRRDWMRAEAIWLNPDSNEPRIELIIRMAQDQRLIETLDSISQSPRRILVRVRENTPVSRIRELDAACLRNYVRLPGRNAIEKAGTRQELLSVQRRASHDTLENRITAWTLNNLQLRSESWKRLHGSRSKSGTRYRAVSKLSRSAINYLNSSFIAEARYSTLSHPVPANYPLMMDPRYKRVYRAYRELLRYDKIKDESWTWRRVLWSEGVTQLLSCTLRRLLPEMYSSRPYYRSEPDRGKWLLSPASAGPFSTSWGPLIVIDAHESDLKHDGTLHPPDGSKDPIWSSIGVLGCDLILWWPDRNRFFPIWANLWTGNNDNWLKLLANAARAITGFRRHLSEVGSVATISRGLIIGTSLNGSAVEIDIASSEGATAVGIPVPMELDTQDVGAFSKLIETLEQAIELAVDLPK